jgi:hypothetical protein
MEFHMGRDATVLTKTYAKRHSSDGMIFKHDDRNVSRSDFFGQLRIGGVMKRTSLGLRHLETWGAS